MAAPRTSPPGRAPSVYELAATPGARELEAWLEPSAGALPLDLQGTLLRAGPIAPGARFQGHGLEGEGLVAGVSFRAGRARGIARPLGPAPGAAPGGSAHDVFAWGGRVIVAGDRGLRALGTDLGAEGPLPWQPEPGASACLMPRADLARHLLVVFSTRRQRGRPVQLVCHELDERFAEVARSAPVSLGAPDAAAHGHGFTERWYVVPELPRRPPAPRSLLGSWRPARDSRTVLVLVPRGRTGSAVRLELPPESRVVFHVCNAWDDGERVVVDAAAYRDDLPVDPPVDLSVDRPKRAARAALPSLYRYLLDPTRGRVVGARRIADTGTEAASVDPRFRGRRSRYLFGPTPALAGNEPIPAFYGFFHGVGRFDLEEGTVDAWEAGANRLCSPPAFAPRPGSVAEGDGWLLVWLLDGERAETSVAIFDAREPSRGPLATLPLGCRLPVVSHTAFEDELALP